jgi:hypothetical protein
MEMTNDQRDQQRLKRQSGSSSPLSQWLIERIDEFAVPEMRKEAKEQLRQANNSGRGHAMRIADRNRPSCGCAALAPAKASRPPAWGAKRPCAYWS